jgi:predicted LPLAT superfamily acyltransferase
MSGATTEMPVHEAPVKARPKEWDGRTRTGFGILIFYYLFRFLGPRFAYLLLYPVAFYYVLFNRKHGRASADYLRRRYPGLRGLRMFWMRYRHYLSFGRVLVDRGYAFLGMMGQVKFDRDGHQIIEEALAGGKGLILISGHLGNWELAAYCLGGFLRDGGRVPVNAVMFKGESEKVEKQLQRASGEPPFKIITSNDSLQASIDCMEALKRGEIVAIHGDRMLGSGGVKVPFLGSEAKFPIGPYVLAANTGAPVVFTFANRLGTREYALTARGPHYLKFGSRKQRDADLTRWAQMYANVLEELLVKYPLQWHNFYPFWDTEEGTGW